MAKKYNTEEIPTFIDASNHRFREYLAVKLPRDVFQLLLNISKLTEVYIFSGVIRNFFVKDEEIRDLDIVLRDKIEIEKIFEGYNIHKNSYGGYKIGKDNLNIDAWLLQDTWTIKLQGMFDFYLAEYITRTAFFNFSAIIYSINNNKFFYTTDFVNFLRDKKIDVVNEVNPNYPLSIINSFYYSEKYGFPLGRRLKFLIIDVHKVHTDYEKVQIKHFGKIIYTNKEIEEKITTLWSNLK